VPSDRSEKSSRTITARQSNQLGVISSVQHHHVHRLPPKSSPPTRKEVGFTFFPLLASPQVIAFFGNSGVGYTRLAFNVAVFLLSPLTGDIAEKSRVVPLLRGTIVARVLVFAVVLPAAALLLKPHVGPGCGCTLLVCRTRSFCIQRSGV
jgi:hypothetical protein